MDPTHTDKLRRLVERTKGFIFDLDGTLYLGDHLLPGAAEALSGLRAAGKKVAFVSNKPIGTRQEYAEKLNRLGIPCSLDEVINSSLVAARWLQKHHPARSASRSPSRPSSTTCSAHGLHISEDPEQIDVVVVSFDRTFEYRKLEIAYRASLHGAALMATNPDRTCPMPGYNLPDAACMIAAIEACTERVVEPIVGKPSPIMLQEALDILGLEAPDCAMVGDRLETDMKMARDAGLAAVLVLSGVAKAEDVERLGIEPDVVLSGVGEIAEVLQEEVPGS